MSKLLHHLKALFRQKTSLPPVPTGQVVDEAPLTELAKTPSQVEKNLSWLPINRNRSMHPHIQSCQLIPDAVLPISFRSPSAMMRPDAKVENLWSPPFLQH